ncbi:MAG TPA: hypothetical protein VFT91_11675 [Dehalococcoidia bacterium]|nr:hypothetical protein [Dehalococcoidia bacterium]
MPFRFGKGDKKSDEDEAAGLSEDEAGDPVEETADDREDETPEGELDSAEVEDSAEEAPHAEPAPAPPLVRPQFRPDYLDENEASSAQQPSRSSHEPAASEREPSEQAIFVVVRDDQGNAVSVHEFAEPRDARAHVELSVETGTPEERVAVFKGSRVPIQVVRRPVVRLVPKD